MTGADDEMADGDGADAWFRISGVVDKPLLLLLLLLWWCPRGVGVSLDSVEEVGVLILLLVLMLLSDDVGVNDGWCDDIDEGGDSIDEGIDDERLLWLLLRGEVGDMGEEGEEVREVELFVRA